jgi:hypothetical protein
MTWRLQTGLVAMVREGAEAAECPWLGTVRTSHAATVHVRVAFTLPTIQGLLNLSECHADKALQRLFVRLVLCLKALEYPP